MWRDRTRLALATVLLLALVLTVIISVRDGNQPPSLPTVDIGQVQTQAVRTFAVGLTSTALALPTSTETHTPEPAEPTQATASGVASESSISPTPSCYRLKFIQDLTIPDNTLLTSAEVFTKSWQVQNSGTCAWRPGFRMVLVGGVAMGGSPFTLETTVNPGSKIEILIKMVAPTNQTGIVQGTWRMTDADGNQFGDALTVVIVVPNGTAAPTAAPTSTP